MTDRERAIIRQSKFWRFLRYKQGGGDAELRSPVRHHSAVLRLLQELDLVNGRGDLSAAALIVLDALDAPSPKAPA